MQPFANRFVVVIRSAIDLGSFQQTLNQFLLHHTQLEGHVKLESVFNQIVIEQLSLNDCPWKAIEQRSVGTLLTLEFLRNNTHD